ncbi:hypothetical protein [Jiangella asiatica]|uniref:DUF3592 domain-containing protein n=1 Tax=Jiangella asiatica TaxID=2530372 RepID=A0A4R5CPU3_9ACTN|nr:hypothetical protein [Jiangella asiatica]TDE01330.1 hypothetical protein E1269_23505 [Jiangella asiatica]
MPEVDGALERRAGRAGRVAGTLLWTLAIIVALLLAAMLSQIATWGLILGVLVGLTTIAGMGILVGFGWKRALPATLACVLGFAAILFTGPALYEVYMRALGEPSPAVVLEIDEPEGESRLCFVVEEDGGLHEMDQRQNCFDHIDAGQAVSIFEDPLGFLPPRLENAPDDSDATAEVAISAALLAGTAAAVVYGGLRRRTAVPSGSPVVAAPPEAGGPLTFLWLQRVPAPVADESRAAGDAEAAEVAGWQIRGADAVKPADRRATGTVAGVEVEPTLGATPVDYRDASKDGTRALVLWTDGGRRDVYARVRTVSARRRGTAEYEIVGPDDTTLATVTRRAGRFLLLRRTRWTVQQAGRGTAVGVKGHPVSWLVWCLTLPFQPVVVLVSLLSLDGVGPVRAPLRTRWRIDDRTVLDYRTSTGGHTEGLHVLADWFDPRVAAALVTLIGSHDTGFGGRWDLSVR